MITKDLKNSDSICLMVAWDMLYFSAFWSALVTLYKKCPKCGKVQYFKDKKKGGRVVTCKKCVHQFALK